MTETPRPAQSQPAPLLDRLTSTPLPSATVLRGQPSVEIEHNGHIYRLQTTRQGKLILTK